MRLYNLCSIPYVAVVIDVEPIRERFSTVAPFLDERSRRLVAAAEAFAAGYGGIAAMATATGFGPEHDWAGSEGIGAGRTPARRWCGRSPFPVLRWRPYAAVTVSLRPSARTTFNTVA